MRQKVIVAAASGVVVVGVVGLLVWASQQGLFGGKAQQLIAQASRAQGQGKFPEAQVQLETFVTTYPDSSMMAEALLKLGEVYEAQQQFVKARTAYRTLLEKFPDSALIAKTQAALGKVNVALLFSPTITDLDAAYEVKPGDTLGKIATANQTTVDFLKRANALTGSVIRPQQKLKVPKGHFSIVVDKSQNQLLLTENNQFIKLYPVATGKDNSSPVGTFKIVTRITNPVWYKQGAVVPPDSPDNILGTRWLGLEKQGYGIHGTTSPDAIGQQVTAGCVRMRNSDVEELFDIVPIGTDVTIVD